MKKIVFISMMLLWAGLQGEPRNFGSEYNYYGQPLNESINFPENEIDRAITQSIRNALITNGLISNRAKQITIETVNGNVTLRGYVDTYEEKSRVVEIATLINNVQSVKDRLEVANPGGGQ